MMTILTLNNMSKRLLAFGLMLLMTGSLLAQGYKVKGVGSR